MGSKHRSRAGRTKPDATKAYPFCLRRFVPLPRSSRGPERLRRTALSNGDGGNLRGAKAARRGRWATAQWPTRQPTRALSYSVPPSGTHRAEALASVPIETAVTSNPGYNPEDLPPGKVRGQLPIAITMRTQLIGFASSHVSNAPSPPRPERTRGAVHDQVAIRLHRGIGTRVSGSAGTPQGTAMSVIHDQIPV